MKPVVFTPERWYMLWNSGLVLSGIVVFNVVFWTCALYYGPFILEKGLERWLKNR